MGDAHTAHHTQWRGKAGKVHFPGQCGSQIATTSDGSFRAKLEVRERERGRLSPGPWVSLSLVGRKSVWPREVRRAYRAHEALPHTSPGGKPPETPRFSLLRPNLRMAQACRRGASFSKQLASRKSRDVLTRAGSALLCETDKNNRRTGYGKNKINGA